jgi:hypothetical protein
MANMSYCRFENTLPDLKDCQESLGDGEDGLSESEKRARKRLIEVCCQIAEEYGDGELYE